MFLAGLCPLALVRWQDSEASTLNILLGYTIVLISSARLAQAISTGRTNVLAIIFHVFEITRHGGIALCAPIAPYAATRAAVRAMVEEFGGFLLVHVSTPLEVCEARDRKGLYAKARAGHLAEFTGVSDPYEVPVDADFTIDTAKTALDDAVEQVLAAATARGWLTALPLVGRTQPE